MSNGADLDIRWPIGSLFTVMGALLAVFGLATRERTVFHPAGAVEPYALNLDLWWGIAMLLFGLLMMLGAARANAKQRP